MSGLGQCSLSTNHSGKIPKTNPSFSNIWPRYARWGIPFLGALASPLTMLSTDCLAINWIIKTTQLHHGHVIRSCRVSPCFSGKEAAYEVAYDKFNPFFLKCLVQDDDDDDDEFVCNVFACLPYGIGVIVAATATILLIAGIILSTQNG